jgi:hypothetical protein
VTLKVLTHLCLCMGAPTPLGSLYQGLCTTMQA